MLKLLVLLSVLSVGMCMPGGYSPVTNDAQVAEYTALLTKVQQKGSLTLQQDSVQKILSIETQVVAGLNIKYTLLMTDGRTCEVVIFEQAWSNTEVVHQPVCKSKRGMLVGGYSQVDPSNFNNYTIMLAKLEASQQLGLDQYTVQSIETQVVAGLNIKYTLLMNGATCHITVWDQPWTNTRKVTENDCPRKARRQLLGGYNVVDVNDPMVQKCLTMSVERVNAMINTMYLQVVSNTMTAKQQVVAGMNYEVNFQTSQTTCFKGRNTQNCPLDATPGLKPTTWTGHCYMDLSGKMTVEGVDMEKEEETQPDMKLGNDLKLSLKPVSSAKTSISQLNYKVDNKVKDKISMGKGRVTDYEQPVVNLMRKKRNVKFLKQKLDHYIGNVKDIDSLIEKGKSLLGGGNDHDLVNHVKDYIKGKQDILGGGGHNLAKHVEKILGGNTHDMIDHPKKLLGGDDHDLVPHSVKPIKVNLKTNEHNLLGGDGHDMVKHGQNLLGGDGHDMVKHGQNLLGGDGHDMVKHGQNLLGGDGHDMVKHGQNLLGGDGHDMVKHGQNLLGGDGHDMVKHGQNLLGGDGHDMVKHGQSVLGGDDHDMKPHGKRNTTKIGGDGHDYCHKGMFLEFKAKFNKFYGSDKEEEKRYTIFCDNMRTARKLQETEKGTAIYGATKFADLTKEEFGQYVGKKWDLNANLGMKKAAIPRVRAPDSFDWRDHGAVTPVKNQGSCGSCWAFSTTGNIEGQWAIKKKRLISLSEQELVDCDKVDEGCNGGLPSQAYKEIERLGGLDSETDYPYRGEDEKCEFNRTDVRVYINDSVSISSDEAEMASWLAANGPISIGINAFAMQFYMGGISHPWKIFCNPKNLDHGVLIVGYGTQDSKPYWIVKNSWGADWGEKGYYMVYRGDGVCGLNTMCTSAVVD